MFIYIVHKFKIMTLETGYGKIKVPTHIKLLKNIQNISKFHKIQLLFFKLIKFFFKTKAGLVTSLYQQLFVS